jgi:sporulation protein YunB
MRYRTPYLQTKKTKAILFVTLFITAIALLIHAIDSAVSPTLINTCNHIGEQQALTTINNSITSILSDKDYSYSNFVTILRSSDGNISSIETKTQNVNMFQSQISEKINCDLNDTLKNTVNVPLGSVSDVALLSGRGPNIKLKIIPLGNVKTELKSEFTSAGLNQTKHRIILEITADVSSVLPPYSTSVNVKYDCVLAETVIVGKVPDGYFSMTDKDKAAVAQIN